ncbi:hypothetical protein, partial [Variovorax sp. WS11]|uniref:hypothetical protein n=1 Tax=Variovorax sp. WS11 TaxID=1105204 RepID=UPI001C62E582
HQTSSQFSDYMYHPKKSSREEDSSAATSTCRSWSNYRGRELRSNFRLGDRRYFRLCRKDGEPLGNEQKDQQRKTAQALARCRASLTTMFFDYGAAAVAHEFPRFKVLLFVRRGS